MVIFESFGGVKTKRPKYQILLAEDHTLFRDGLTKLINNTLDLEVSGVATNGVEALKYIASYIFDLVILDIVMPEMDGLEVARELHKNKNPVKFIILTGACCAEYLEEAYRLGASAYLLKSASAQEFLDTCRRVIRGAKHPSNEILRPNNPTPKSEKTCVDQSKAKLTPREKQVLVMVANSYRNHEIAEKLCISEKTVARHRENLMGKFGMHDRIELVRLAIRLGLIEP